MIKDEKLKTFIEENDVPIDNTVFGELSNDKVEDMEKAFKRMADERQIRKYQGGLKNEQRKDYRNHR